MTETATLHVLRVFVGPDGRGGNPLGVFLDGVAVPADRRARIAAALGFSETVFVDDGGLQIFTPAAELPFAGHPLVGTSWLLAQQGSPVDVLHPPAGSVDTWADEAGNHWIRGRAEWTHAIPLREYDDAAQIDALDGVPVGLGSLDAWAWLDEAAGEVRSRVFAPEIGIEEDEATGSAAVRLVTALGREVTIRQGVGSVLYARPGPDGSVDVGGAVALVETRNYPIG